MPTADRSTLLILATRCEAVTGPDRMLDGEIWRATEPDGIWTLDYHGVWMRQDEADHVAYDMPPAYTSSLDAAVSLVSNGYDWHVQNNPSVNAAWASVGKPTAHWGDMMRRAATPALALCAAALRARAMEVSDAR